MFPKELCECAVLLLLLLLLLLTLIPAPADAVTMCGSNTYVCLQWNMMRDPIRIRSSNLNEITSEEIERKKKFFFVSVKEQGITSCENKIKENFWSNWFKLADASSLVILVRGELSPTFVGY